VNTYTNRQMAAQFKKLGFEKSPIQMTRVGLTYKHPKGSALFTFGKRPEMNVQISAPDDEGWTMIILTEMHWARFMSNPFCQFPMNPDDDSEYMSAREFLLCVARGYANYKKSEGGEA